jgi:hypothetical protein
MPFDDRGLQIFLDGLDEAIDRGTHARATRVKDKAVENAPEDEGDLKETGRVEPEQPDGSMEARVVFGGKSGSNKYVDYADVVEEGDPDRPNYPAQPYLGPAARDVDDLADVAAELQALIQRSRIR